MSRLGFSSLKSTMILRLLSSVVQGLVKEAILLYVIASLPSMWYSLVKADDVVELTWSMNVPGLVELAADKSLSRLLASTGLCLVVGGKCYRQLPVQLIPGMLPVIGSWDHSMALMLMMSGLLLMLSAAAASRAGL
ncbi:hypothetical protein FOZ60_013365 [Perkinsus olseni]|uniref:Uncharacterized protein n=1 Tax=Perkinsus olseni TaxID=32597 RepID=A0A7J6PLP4_PEROL|nr:hypothetical protein FOZ60_013365 [Perkinsus olseni]